MPTLAKKCLLIKLPEGDRHLFTHHKNYPNLLEFGKKFNAKLEVVKAIKPPLLNLNELAHCICDQNYTARDVKYETVYDKETHKKTLFMQHTAFNGIGSREKMLKKVSDIRQYIYDMLSSGQSVKIKDLKTKFQKHQLSSSTIYRHFNHVKRRLKSEGSTITKVSVGVYKAAKN